VGRLGIANKPRCSITAETPWKTPWLMGSYISKVQVTMHSALDNRELKKRHLLRLAMFIDI
jgi:hypothetical protein